MQIIGLIAEYNPLHNGHIYQINKIKELYPDSMIILILNGYFMQRGDISVLSKEDKVKYSLESGIDLVLELPCYYGTQASDIFAYQSIKILNEFKIDTLVFGSESNNLDLLKEIASKQEDLGYQLEVKELMLVGNNYPTALAKALHIENFEFKPNDLLGISYIKAINEINPNINVVTIKRTNDYLDIDSDETIVSASNIRNKLLEGLDVSKYTPYKFNYNYCDMDKLFNILKVKILTDNNLDIYMDVNEGLDNKLKKVIKKCNSFEDIINKIKTKRYTYNRINRMLIHILLGITKEKYHDLYIRVLGFNQVGKNYLHDLEIKINNYKDTSIYDIELMASQIYDILCNLDTYSYEIKNIPIYKD